MRIICIISFLLILPCIPSIAHISQSYVHPQTNLNQLNISTNKTIMHYSYSFDVPIVTHNNQKKETTFQVTIDNISSDSFESNLILPIKHLVYLLPKNQRYQSIQKTTTEHIFEDLSFDNINNNQRQNTKWFQSAHIGNKVPTQPITINGNGSFRGYTLLFLSINPIYFDETIQRFKYVSWLNFTINTEQSSQENILFRNRETDMNLIIGSVENPEIMETYHLTSTDFTHQSSSDPEESYPFIIITTSDLEPYFSRYVSYKNNYISTHIVTLNYVSSNFYGKDMQERIRECIKFAYQHWGTEYVLLGGDANIIPYRGLSCIAIDHQGKKLIDHGIPGDIYYGGLDGTWDYDGDGRYGENIYNSTREEADFLAEVYVGRAPVENKAEIDTFTDKVISFETSVKPKTIQLHQSGINAKNEPDSTVIPERIAHWIPSNYTVNKLYQANQEVTLEDWKTCFEQETLIVQHTGNGEIDYYYIDYPRHMFSTVQSMTLIHDFFPIHTSLACHSGAFDYEDCLAETLLLSPYGGASACIFNSRWGFTDAKDIHKYSGEIIEQQFFELFRRQTKRLGPIHQLAKENFAGYALSDPGYRWCMFTLNLLGDPETPVLEKRSSDITHHHLYVDDDYNQTTAGWNITHFNSIQKSIDTASEWDTIHVKSGIYNERILIKKTLNIIGEKKETTIIDGSRGKGSITISASRVRFEGFTLTNDGSLIENSRIDVSNSNYLIISDCIIEQNSIGIYASGSNNLIVLNNTFKGNLKSVYATVTCGNMYIIGNTFTLKDPNSYALYLQANGKYYIHNNTIQSQTDFSNASYGIYVDGNSVIQSNIIENCHIGIWMTSGSHRIISNMIQHNKHCAVYVYHASSTIEGNTIQENGNNFIAYQHNIKPGGIIVEASINQDCHIQNNHIIKNRGWGVYLEGLFGNNNEISRNDFIQNSRQAMFINTRCFWYQNYWEKETIFPKIIFGFIHLNFIFIPMIQIDFSPSSNTYL